MLESRDRAWRKSSRSGSSNCVEVAITGRLVKVRDSKRRSRAVLRFSYAEWRAFVAGVNGGEFDIPEE